MNFIKIATGPDGAARYVNLDQVVSVDDSEDGFKLKMSDGEIVERLTASLKAEILQKVGHGAR